jgi:hypothetical protein
MAPPYGWNTFIMPTLTQMGIAVALFDTPFAGERSLSRTFDGSITKEIKSLIDRGIDFNTELLLWVFLRVGRDITKVHDFCCVSEAFRRNSHCDNARLTSCSVNSCELRNSLILTVKAKSDVAVPIKKKANAVSAIAAL